MKILKKKTVVLVKPRAQIVQVRPATKKLVVVKKRRRKPEPEPEEDNLLPFKTLSELEDNRVYGVYCSLTRAFGCRFLPAMGYELKRLWKDVRNLGAVHFWRSSKSRMPSKDAFLVKSPVDSGYFAVELFRGDYEPPKEQKKVFRFKPKKT